MIEIGRVCLKIAGRDAGKKCAVIEIVDDKSVLIDGQTRRKKCNIIHLEPTKTKLSIKKGASHSEIVKEFSKLGMEIKETKSKKAKPKPEKARKKQAPKK